MFQQIHFPALPSLLAATALGLAACGGGSSSGMMAPTSQPQMKLSVSDAPVDGATHVVVVFTGVELTGNSGLQEVASEARTRLQNALEALPAKA